MVWLTTCVVGGILGTTVIISIPSFVVEPFIVTDNTMAPRYEVGDYLLVEKWSTHALKGDVVIAHVAGTADNPSEYQLQQIIGVPGDTIDSSVVPSGEYFISDTNDSLNPIFAIPQNAVIGKPIIDFGKF
jgi:signal peptidase I